MGINHTQHYVNGTPAINAKFPDMAGLVKYGGPISTTVAILLECSVLEDTGVVFSERSAHVRVLSLSLSLSLSLDTASLSNASTRL